MLDYLFFPLFVGTSLFAGWGLLMAGIPNLLVTPLVVGPLVLVTWLLERVRPARPFPAQREFPVMLEVAHFVFNFELGYSLALAASWLLERSLRTVLPTAWPTSWPIAVQLAWAVTLYEASSYWQHRAFHFNKRLWPFHALHHSGSHLDLFRAARFHVVDFTTVAFLAYLPLVVLGTPDDIITLLAILVSALGLAHHGNIRQRTPAWLDWHLCTPAVHRLHHSRKVAESNTNFANTVMWFDHLFGTYAAPGATEPEALGNPDDPLATGFWAQFTDPFRGRVGVGRVASEHSSSDDDPG